LEQSQSEKDKIRVLKAMGNCGAKELVVPIKSVIDDKNEQLVVRTQAVFALRKIAKHFNKLVRTIDYATTVIHKNTNITTVLVSLQAFTDLIEAEI